MFIHQKKGKRKQKGISKSFSFSAVPPHIKGPKSLQEKHPTRIIKNSSAKDTLLSALILSELSKIRGSISCNAHYSVSTEMWENWIEAEVLRAMNKGGRWEMGKGGQKQQKETTVGELRTGTYSATSCCPFTQQMLFYLQINHLFWRVSSGVR